MQYLDITKKSLTDIEFDKTLINKVTCFGCCNKVKADDPVELVNRSRQTSYTDDDNCVKWETIEINVWYCKPCYAKIYKKHRWF
jgi:hypothetical protein